MQPSIAQNSLITFFAVINYVVLNLKIDSMMSKAALDGFRSTGARNGTDRDGSVKGTATGLKNTYGTGKQTGPGTVILNRLK